MILEKPKKAIFLSEYHGNFVSFSFILSGFESILEGLFGPALLKDLNLFKGIQNISGISQSCVVHRGGVGLVLSLVRVNCIHVSMLVFALYC